MQDYILRNWSIVRGGTSSAQKALFFNLRRLRARLATRVRVLRGRAAEHGLVLVGGMFPVQSTGPVRTDLGRRLLARLAADDVHAVLRRTCGGGSAVTLVVTVAHHRSEVDRAAAVLGLAWQELGGRVRRAR